MKCNLDKMNDFFKNNHDEDIKNFIIKMLEDFSQREYNDNYVCFLQLGFFEIEEDDCIDDFNEDLYVIDFHKISNLEDNLKKFILKLIEEYYDDGVIVSTVLMPYKNWEKINRKNKLINLSILSIPQMTFLKLL